MLKTAKEKQMKKVPVKPKLLTKTENNISFSAAALSTFKANRRRRVALTARAGIKDRRPAKPDRNIWKSLIVSRMGYIYSAKVLTRILRMFQTAGSRSHSGPKPLYKKALWLLFSAERANSYETV